MVAVFVSQSAAVLKLHEEGVQQTFVTANWRSTREIFAVARTNNLLFYYFICRSQCPRGLRRRSTAARLLRSWVRIPPSVCCECCVLSGRGLCDELISRPEGSCRLWCDLETTKILVNEEEAKAH